MDNVVEANLLAARSGTGFGEALNIACSSSVSLNELFGIIQEIIGTNIKPVYGPAAKGDILHSKADISKAKKILGYAPATDIRQGLVKTIEWFQKNGFQENRESQN